MKKLLLFVVVCFSYVTQAQTDRLISAYFAAPVGDASDVSSFAFGIDAASLFYITDDFYLGPSIGFTHFIGKEQDEFSSQKTDGITYLYFAGSAQYSFSRFFVAADIGFTFYSSDSDLVKIGIYYQPKIGYHIIDALDVYASYKGLPGDGLHLATLGGGLSYRF